MAAAAKFAKIAIKTKYAPAAIGPYSQGIRAGNLLFVSGQLGLDPKTGEFSSTSVAGQTEQVLKNLKAVLDAGGSSLENVVKTTILLKDISDFGTVNSVYGKYFPETSIPPARATYAVSALPKGALVELEAIALAAQEKRTDINKHE